MFHYAVLGDPIDHSISPQIHRLFAKQAGIALTYEAMATPRRYLKSTLASLQARGYQGVNITLPCKEEAFAWLENCSARAREARAINTIIFYANGSYYGDNTDGIGFMRDLTMRQQFSCQGKNILMLGAGGAARGFWLRWRRKSQLMS